MAKKNRKPRRVFSDAMRSETKVVAYGYVGRWIDGTLGWFLPEFAAGDKRCPEQVSERARQCVSKKGSEFTLCRITVEAVPGARKRIVRPAPATTDGGAVRDERDAALAALREAIDFDKWMYEERFKALRAALGGDGGTGTGGGK